MSKTSIMIKDLIEAAKKEDWESIDSQIPRICNNPTYLLWAYEKGIKRPDGNVRDLAVSILEKANIPPKKFSQIKPELLRLMRADSNPYVRFRSAFTLAAHNQSNEEVKQVLKQAQNDPNVAEIAKEYLSR